MPSSLSLRMVLNVQRAKFMKTSSSIHQIRDCILAHRRHDGGSVGALSHMQHAGLVARQLNNLSPRSQRKVHNRTKNMLGSSPYSVRNPRSDGKLTNLMESSKDRKSERIHFDDCKVDCSFSNSFPPYERDRNQYTAKVLAAERKRGISYLKKERLEIV